ncbi:MAG: FixH family protein [gamma proteobacterium symbiont of Taylorina sp.]|nr:FixH family protein [gamma proteobacterium symbiont of Taylorina sp.]
MKAEEKLQHWYKSPLLLIWLFLVLMAMSGTIYMVIQANSGFSGLVVEDFYERGQDYEENIHKKLENSARWRPEFKIKEINLNQETIIEFNLSDKQGRPAVVEKLTLFAYRPSNAKEDFSVPMTILKDGKTYQAPITFSNKGKWDLLASAIIDGIEVNYAKSIFVKD